MASEVDLSLPVLGMKNKICGRLIFIAVLLLALSLNGQAAASNASPCLDENLVHQAMGEEAFRLLAQRIAASGNGTAGGFDYHIEQACEIIKKRLPPEPLSAVELAAWLRRIFQNPDAADSDREFRALIEQFVLGMSLEIINTLQNECDQAVNLIARVGKLEGEIKRTPHADRDTLNRALRQSGLSKKMFRLIKNIDRYWIIPPAGAGHFSAFKAWKKNMTGRSGDDEQKLVFDLGDRYQAQYPFLGEFMENYRRLAETFRQAVRDLNDRLDNSSDPDFKVFD
jgi:hypothetical protein